MNQLRVLAVVIGAALVVVVFTFPLWRPFLNTESVNEGFPGLSPDQQSLFVQLPPEQQRAYRDLVVTAQPAAIELLQAALQPDRVVPEGEQALPPLTDPAIVASGRFTGMESDVLRLGEGTVTVYELPNRSQFLRFEDFRVTNGPLLHVILTRLGEPQTAEDVGQDYIDLGELKGNVGNQNYEVPNGVSLLEYRGVVIFDLRHNIVFSTARLQLRR
jgi:Electron transfer DM13